jgi:ribosomal-protein-alanine N-acetyltransferase
MTKQVMITQEEIKNNFFAAFPTLTTNRLILRALSIRDEKEIFKLRSDEQVNKYLDRAPSASIEDARSFIDKIVTAITNKTAFYWAIARKQNDNLVGTICYFNISDNDRKAEMGFELLPEFQGAGIMREALSAVIEFGIAAMKLQTIEAFVHSDNFRSIILLQKFNFKEDSATDNNSGDSLICLKLSNNL